MGSRYEFNDGFNRYDANGRAMDRDANTMVGGVNVIPCILWVASVFIVSTISMIFYPIYAPLWELYERKFPPKGADISTPTIAACKLGCKATGVKKCITAAYLSAINDKKGTHYGFEINSERKMTWRDKGSYDDGYSATVKILKVDNEAREVDIQYDYGLVEHKVPFCFFDPVQTIEAVGVVSVIVDDAAAVAKDSGSQSKILTAVVIHPEAEEENDADLWQPPMNISDDLEGQTAAQIYFAFWDNQQKPFCNFWSDRPGWYLQGVPGGETFFFEGAGRYPSPMTHASAWVSGRQRGKYKVDFIKTGHSSEDSNKEAFAFRYHDANFQDPKYKDMAVSGIFEEVEYPTYKVEGKKIYSRVRMFKKGEMKEIFGNRKCYSQTSWGVLEYILGHSDYAVPS